MKTIPPVFLLLLLALATCASSARAQEGWLPVPMGSAGMIRSLFCVDSLTLHACGAHGLIATSTTGGESWLLTTVDTRCYFSDICFTAAGTGFLCGYDTLTLKAVLYRTTDGGSTWHLHKTGDDYSGYITLCFIDADTGFIGMHIGTNGTILKTTDAGETWTPFGATAYIRAIHFADGMTGLATGQGGVVYKTTDAGTSWVEKFQLPNAPRDDFYSVFFTDPVTAFACGDRGYLYRSTDAGETWHPLSGHPSFTGRFTSLWFTGPSTGFVVGDSGTIMNTTDRGATWHRQHSTTADYLADVCFVNTEVGFVCGDHGLVLKTTSGGMTGDEEPAPSMPPRYHLEQNFPNPFNPSTTIRYGLPRRSQRSLTIYTSLGQLVTVLADGEQEAGDHELTFDATGLSSGVYFCRLQAGGFVQTRTLHLVR